MRKSRLSKRLVPEVGIVMGSDSDWPKVEKAAETLGEFGVGYEVRVISAHRTPREAAAYALAAAGRGIKVIIAAAGGAAHLAGVLAAHTILPVLGIPIESGTLHGLDALLSTVQMPSGVPVGTVTLGSAGAVNAAVLAVRILALSHPNLAGQLKRHKRKMKSRVGAGDARVRKAVRQIF